MKDGKTILQEVLRHTGESKNSLAKKIGLKRSQNLYDIESGKVKGISSELSEKIVKRYPEINREYLLKGQGSFSRATNIRVASDQDIDTTLPDDTFTIEATPEKAFEDVYQRMIHLEDRANAYEAILAALMAINKIDPMEQATAKEYTEKIEQLRARVSKEADKREEKLRKK